jgi:uncharacterized membrane protein
MNATAPLIKIEMIRRSVRCQVLGIVGLFPLLGLPLAIAALAENRRVRRISGGQWNPAHRQLHRGVFCARVGVLLLFAEATLAVAVYIKETT